MKPVFSVVMPTYGVEKYIEHAIQSIQEQTFAEWELIVVDDCTPDKSAVIAEKIAETDSRIKVIHHEKNRGLSESRNTGIQKACGDYIWFMDPDDWVESQLMQKVAESLEINAAEVVVFGLWEEYYDQNGTLQYTHRICPQKKIFTRAERHPKGDDPFGAADIIWICLEQILSFGSVEISEVKVYGCKTD